MGKPKHLYQHLEDTWRNRENLGLLLGRFYCMGIQASVTVHTPNADVQCTGRIGKPREFPDESPVNGHATERLIFSHGYYSRSAPMHALMICSVGMTALVENIGKTGRFADRSVQCTSAFGV